MSDGNVVENGEAIAPIVVGRAELRVAGNGFDLLRPGTESEIAPADGNCSRRGAFFTHAVRPAHFTVAAPVRAINPVVDPPIKPVHAQLLVAFGETLTCPPSPARTEDGFAGPTFDPGG